jgi:hypothetical protein
MNTSNKRYSTAISSDNTYSVLSAAIDTAEKLKAVRNDNFNVIKTKSGETKVWDDFMVESKSNFIDEVLYTTNNGVEFNLSLVINSLLHNVNFRGV